MTITTSTAHARLLDALTAAGSKISNGGRAATCPSHEDNAPSLSIGDRRDGDGVLVNCHAGCSLEDVLAALGMTPADLFDEPRKREPEPVAAPAPKPRTVATYDYLDESGTLLYQKVRLEPKSFRQRRPDGRGGWVWSLGDTRRVLYRLPSVVAAVAAGERVWLAEGEKDADSLAAAGVTATTATEGAWKPGSTPKWRPEYTETLAGAHVLIVADRDEPGRHTAATIAGLLDGTAASVLVLEPAEGKDVSDHLTAGRTLDELVPLDLDAEAPAGGGTHVPPVTEDEDDEEGRRVVLTSAAHIKPRPVFWLWAERIALGTLALLAGREGLGKSTLAYWIAARITRGELPGEYQGSARAVLVAATEDSWEHTIVPRLIAAGADLTQVYRVDVITDIGIHVGLSMPRDLIALERSAKDVGAALLLLDPLMSRLGSLDTHRDAEVRQALEPLVAIADRAHMSVLGLIHHNKSGSADPLQLVMGSKAFTAVARSVHTVVADPEDESERRRLFGTPKNNLGRTDLPTLSFVIGSHAVDTDEGTAWTGRLEWGEDSAVSVGDAMRRAADSDTADDTTEAVAWLTDYLTSKEGRARSKDVKKAAEAEGIRVRALAAARKRLRLTLTSEGFPRVTWWELPVLETPSGDSQNTPPRGDVTTVLTVSTGDSGDSRDSQDGPRKPRINSVTTDHDETADEREPCQLHGRDYVPADCWTCEQVAS